MTQQTLSLMDILCPPVNQWLAELAKRKSNLPAGVRVVRFGDGDDEVSERDDGAAAVPPARQKLRRAA